MEVLSLVPHSVANMTDLLRTLPALGLLALIPIAVFTLDRSAYILVLSMISVLLIVWSIRTLFTGGDEDVTEAAH